MKIAKLSISSDKEIIDIMNIEIDKDVGTIAQDMQFNNNLPSKVKQRARDLLETDYINAQRPLNPAVENTMTLTLTNNESTSENAYQLY